MPQINLLLSSSRKKTTKVIISPQDLKLDLSKIYPAALKHSAISFGICLLIWLILFFSNAQKTKALSDYEEKVTVLTRSPKEVEEIIKERAVLEKKIKLMDTLFYRKFFWHEKLTLLSDLIPDGIWLTDISSQEENAISPQRVGRSMIGVGQKTILVVKGTAVAPKIQDAVSLIGDFIKNLQENSEFSKDFVNIKLNTVVKGSIGGTDVMQFDFFCESKEQ